MTEVRNITMTARKMILAAAAVLALGGAAVATVAVAQTSAQTAVMRQAKADGVIGEQNDGFLGVRTTASAEVREAVEAVNAARRAVYAQAAAQNNVSVDAAGATAFQTQYLPRIASGQWYQDASGAWIQKR
jgi:uncharacterized protein YdbL (DUF1318 family)